jgi:hypothetical protein
VKEKTKAKNADELAEIISIQLDILAGNTVSDEEVRISDAIANQIGKSLKLASLRMAYEEHKKQNGALIETLEGRR